MSEPKSLGPVRGFLGLPPPPPLARKAVGILLALHIIAIAGALVLIIVARHAGLDPSRVQQLQSAIGYLGIIAFAALGVASVITLGWMLHHSRRKKEEEKEPQPLAPLQMDSAPAAPPIQASTHAYVSAKVPKDEFKVRRFLHERRFG